MAGAIRKNIDLSAGTDNTSSLPIEGSSTVFVENNAIVRVGDKYAPHPGSPPHPNREASQGSDVVSADNKKVHRSNDNIDCGDNANPLGSSTVHIGEQFESVDGEMVPVNPFSSYAQSGVNTLTGSSRASADEEGETSPGDAPPPAEESDNTPADEKPQPASSCDGVTAQVDYNFQLSSHFKLRNYSIACVFKHKIQAQHGLSVPDIVCNLKALSENCIEPILAQYPGLRINSGFRTSTGGGSQHERGQAADIQWPSFSFNDYWTAIHWIKDNINYDQLLFEYGNSVWIHCSFKRTGNRSKSASNAVMTMYNGHYTPGLHKYR